MNSTAIGPSASKISEKNVLPVAVPILSLDPRLRGVVRGTSNVSLVVRATSQNYLNDRIQPTYFRQIAPRRATAGPRLASLDLRPSGHSKLTTDISFF